MRTLIPALGCCLLLTACTPENNIKKVEAKYACAPVFDDKAWYLEDNKAPLFDGLGNMHYPIETKDPLVQRYFDQGLVLAYAFNHAEAARSFHYASKLDTNCAMTQWGFAYVLGPNYNAGMEDDHYERAFKAITKAKELAIRSGNVKEQKMIDALAKRYAEKAVEDRYPLDVAYSEAMGELYKDYPEDVQIAVLYGESLMNLHKWDLYDKQGLIKEWTPEILDALGHALELDPENPGANHFYIHAVEMSSSPELAMESARRFDDGLVPNAGHLVHMSSHVYIRTGDYHLGTISNIKASEVDSSYVAACNAQGAYPLAYYPHNQHFLAATAALEGNSQYAIYASDALSANANLELMKIPGWGTIQHYYSIPFYVYVKFAKWDEILKMENKAEDLLYPSAMYHYARGMAFCAGYDLQKAKEEYEIVHKIAQDESLKDISIWEINTVFDLVAIADNVLKAKILTLENDQNSAIELLEQAVAMEDALNYNEPPDWFFSIRHRLGHELVNKGDYEAAVQCYENDLRNFPKNPWAYRGLVRSYEAMNDEASADAYLEKFNLASAYADVELESSILE